MERDDRISESWAPADPALAEALGNAQERLDRQFSATFVMVSQYESKIYGVEFLPPHGWRIQADRGPFSGLVTDGTTHVAVDRGDVLFRGPDAEPVVSHRLRNMFSPMTTFDWSASRVTGRRRSIRNGRHTWEFDVEVPGSHANTLLVDVDTGVLVAMRNTDGPERLELHDFSVFEPDPARFAFDGPVRSRPNGIAYVTQDRATETAGEQVRAHWDLRVGPDWDWVLSVKAPDATDITDLVEWARARAEAVQVRIGQHYSAGSRQPPGGPYPTWQDR